jgi:hypothetical protein
MHQQCNINVFCFQGSSDAAREKGGEGYVFKIQLDDLQFDGGLQIIQADLLLEIQQEQVVNESICLDVGMPSLLRSVFHELKPNRWAVDHWETLPFFICGCGDPDCKAFSFMVQHLSGGEVKLTEIEENEDGSYRSYGVWRVDLQDYAREIVRVAEQFLEFVEHLDYRPQFPQTVEVIKTYVKKIKQDVLV